MAHVQRAGDVGRRDGDDEVSLGLDLAVRAELGLEEAALLPPLVAAGLDGLGVVGIGRLLLLDLLLLLLGLGLRVGGGGQLGLLLRKLLGLFSLLALALD